MHLTRLGPYEIGEPLGKGGMGSVFEAVDTHTGQLVAVKALSPHLAMADGFRERFEAEIESLKTLRHDGIVRLYGYGEQDGVLFYSMELVEGISLEDELKAGRRFNWREVTSIAIQLSLALKHAHDHGIVHRDIKPANILLYGDDHVKLADFGIARLFGTTQLTTAGGVLGTADYMSPEQADGRPVTARCDQYSLGGVMYALLAGRPPFLAKNLPQMLQLQRFAKPEPVRRYAPDTPEQLERVITQLLAKNPAERFPNTQVLARHLQAMVRALSRPTSDEFALTGEPHVADPLDELHRFSDIEVTQLEADLKHPTPAPELPKAGRTPAQSQDAETMAADEHMLSQPSGNHVPATPAPAPAANRPAASRPSLFITVEEEEARLRAENERSWLTIVAQLASLAAVLAGMIGVAVYLSRPTSADTLYQTITMRDGNADEATLTKKQREIREFLQYYPTDARADEIARYHHKLELDKAERRLQRELRGGPSDESLLPVEQLYLRAVNTASASPETALSMLRSIVALYGTTTTGALNGDGENGTSESGAGSADVNRTNIVVQLAERRLAAMQQTLAKQREALTAELRERLTTAERLAASEPQKSAAMFRAIVDLYQQEDWAKDIVAEARERMKRAVEKTNDQ